MKGSCVQSIIKELRGEKIDIIEWYDEPSFFAANALSHAKVYQVRITDINNRQMEVIVGEDQLSLAIGKKGQNVRLATRLVGWDIKIVSEDVLKKEIARQMGHMMAAGEAVPISALQGVSATQAEILEQKGINDVEALAATSVDDLVDVLDVSFDEAQKIIASANAIVEARNAEFSGPEDQAEKGESSESEVSASESSEANLPAEASTLGEAGEEPVSPPEAADNESAEIVGAASAEGVSANDGEPAVAEPASEAEDESRAFADDAQTPAKEER